MSFSFDLPKKSMEEFLRFIAVSPNREQCESLILQFKKVFPKGFPVQVLEINSSLAEKFQLAQKRLTELNFHSDLMEKIERIFSNSLQLETSIAYNLKKIFDQKPLQNSCLDDWLHMIRFTLTSPLQLEDLEAFIGSDWYGIYELGNDNFALEPLITFKTLFSYIAHKQTMQISPCHPTWKLIGDKYWEIHVKLEAAEKGKLQHPSEKALEYCKEGNTIYYPIGFADYNCNCLHLIAIDYSDNKYRLRLLTPDNEDLLAKGTKKKGTHCPEVIWEEVSPSIISSEDFWKPLFEAATLTKEERLRRFRHRHPDLFMFDSYYIITWITRKLGFAPVSWNIEYDEASWQTVIENKYSNNKKNFPDIESTGKRPSAAAGSGSIILKTTQKMMSSPSIVKRATFHKFAHLLALDILPDINEYKLFKAELRLLILVSAFSSLQEGKIMPLQRGTFMKLMELGVSKVTAPLEQLLANEPSLNQIESAKSLIATLAELKHRYELFRTHTDIIRLAPPVALYPSVHKTFKIAMEGIAVRSFLFKTLDAVIFKTKLPAFPEAKTWHLAEVGQLNEYLEGWYQILFDMHSKCEPAAIITMAHRKVFSKLPIPQTAKVEDIFPEPLSEGLLVGTMIFLQKICSLVVSVAYEEAFIPPHLIADITRAYRFGFELFRRLDPKIHAIPVSWHALHRYLECRHSYHASGNCREVMDQIALSFKAISPKGHLQPSEDFHEIPLFYHSWKEYPDLYKLHRTHFIDSSDKFSVNEILTVCELADGIGLKIEETGGRELKWHSSFIGQALAAMTEISQYHVITIYVNPELVKKEFKIPDYERVHLHEHIGPEDHFRLGPSSQWRSRGEGKFRSFVGGDFDDQIVHAKVSMANRLVGIQDERLSKTLKDLPVTLVDEFRPQAELLKTLPVRGASQQAYYLNQIASGPSELSCDLVLEYFETRPSLLLNRDYRAYFSGIMNSAYILADVKKIDTTILHRLSRFLQKIIEDDERHLHDSRLHVDRLLWVSERLRNVLKIAPEEFFLKQLEQVLEILLKNPDLHSCSAAHILSINFSLGYKKLPLLELARFHLLAGRYPPVEPNQYEVWLDACYAMQERAQEINEALQNGPVELRKQLWRLVLETESEVEQAIAQKPTALDLAVIGKVHHQIKKLTMLSQYLEKWLAHFKEYSWRNTEWRENASKAMHPTVLSKLNKGFKAEMALGDSLQNVSRISACYNETAVVLQIGKKHIYIDWEFGYAVGTHEQALLGSRLSPHIRRNPSLKLLGPLLQKNIKGSGIANEIYFEDFPDVSVNIASCEAFYKMGQQKFRLAGQAESLNVIMPASLKEGFSLWVDHSSTPGINGVIVAHRDDGGLIPVFYVDRNNEIHPIGSEDKLSLADTSYFHEAEIFSRWGFKQEKLLIWLDRDLRVREIHVPVKFADQPYLRFVREKEGRWKISGTDLHLISNDRAIPSFAGHHVYLVAEDGNKKPFMLLVRVPEIDKYRKSKIIFAWNQVIANGANDEMRLYRILPSGQIEGLTVADNLMLILWKFHMGHFEAAAELAKRWIAPPGRPYNKQEQELLLPWLEIVKGTKLHPSSIALHSYIIARLGRHLHEYPPTEGKLWDKLVGDPSITWEAKYRVKDAVFVEPATKRGLRRAELDTLVSAYDQETLLRLTLGERDSISSNSFTDHLDQRLGYAQKKVEKLPIELHLAIEGYFADKDPTYKVLNFDRYCSLYPYYAQQKEIPVDSLKRTIVITDCSTFFDYAYTLLKQGPQSEKEKEEYQALETAIKNLRIHQPDFCVRYYMDITRHNWNNVEKDEFIYWLLLEQVFLFKEKGGKLEDLPELPSVTRRFGLTIGDSKDKAKEFLHAVGAVNGKDPTDLEWEFYADWFAKRKTRYADQSYPYGKISRKLDNSVRADFSHQLTRSIEEWKTASFTESKSKRLHVRLSLSHWEKAKLADLAPDALSTFLKSLNLEIDKFKAKTEASKTALLAEANQLPDRQEEALAEMARQLFYVSPCSLDECIGLALQADHSAWEKACPHANPELLQKLVLDFFNSALELQHLLRLQQQTQACIKNSKDADLYRQLEETNSTTRKYPTNSDSMVIMATEYYADTRLRMSPDQAYLIETLTQENASTAVQAIMGSGKSKMIAPCYLQAVLGTGKIPILCVPNSLYRTTLSDLQSMMWDRFKTHVRAFEFDRDSCDIKKLHILAEKLKIAQDEPTVFVCRPRNLHAFQLILKERHQLAEDMRGRLRHFVSDWADSCGQDMRAFKAAILDEDWIKADSFIPSDLYERWIRWYNSHSKLEAELEILGNEADLIQAILNLLQNKSAILVDEAANIFDPKNQLSFPIGWQESANPQAAVVAGKLYFEWLPEHEDKLHLQENMQSLTSPEERQAVYELIAKRAWQEYRQLKDIPAFELFRAYMFSIPITGARMKQKVDEWNKSDSLLDRQIAQQLAFLKYCLTSGLEGALTSTAFVDYGRSLQDENLHLAIPYERANLPKENTLFRRPWKSVLIACQYYSQTWRDTKQTMELINFLHGVDPKGKEADLLEAGHAIWGRRFLDEDISNEQIMKQLTEELDRARLDPKKSAYARLLIRMYLETCVFPLQLKIDPAQLTSTTQDLPMIASKTDAMGGTFSFESTWNLSLVRKRDLSIDKKILAALEEPRNQTCRIMPSGGIEAFLQQKIEGFMALIDAGAMFKGMSNESAAKRLLSQLPDFDAILYYDEIQTGGARLAIMTKTAKTILEQSDHEGVKRAMQQLKVCKPFAYYDQARCIGADLDLPDGKALVTFSDKVTKDDLLQAVMRCRKLLDGRHSVEFAVPPEMGASWNGLKVVEQASLQQDKQEEKANFHAICDQLRGNVRALIDREMRSCPNHKERHAIYKRVSKFLLELQENDLVATFGNLPRLISTDRALGKLVANLYLFVSKAFPNAKFEMEKTLKGILTIHKKRGTRLPRFIREGEESDDATQEIDLSKDMDRLLQMEEEYERMLGTRHPKEETPWKVYKTDWIVSHSMGSVSEHPGMPTLFKLSEAVAERSHRVPFSNSLLVSENMLATYYGQPNCLLTSNQKPVHRCLLVNGVDPKLVLLTEEDASRLKKLLVQLGEKEVYMIETNGTVDMRGDQNQEIVVNLWETGSMALRSLLLQAMIFQGNALCLEAIPQKELKKALNYWILGNKDIQRAVRAIFEAALECRSDDLMVYRKSAVLKALFR